MRAGEPMIFDCDGVVLASNRLKTNAFEHVARQHGEGSVVDEFVRYHVRNGGVSRFEKFRYLFETLLELEDWTSAYESALNEYDRIVEEGYRRCEEVPGVREFLERAFEMGFTLGVASGSEEAQLRRVLSDRGLAKFFSAIFGSPRDKTEGTALVLARAGRDGVDASGVFFGDSRKDFMVASRFGLGFVFVEGYSEWPAEERDESCFLATISDFVDLDPAAVVQW